MKSTLTVVTLVLVLLLVWADDHNKDQDQEPQCEELRKTIPPQHLHKTEGSWILVWAVSNGTKGQAVIPKFTSQNLTLHLLDNKTLHFDEKNFYRGQKWNCSHYVLNATVADSNNKDVFKLESDGGIAASAGKKGPFSDNVTIWFHQSCEHCLHMVYNSVGWDNFIFIYKRDGHHTDVEQKEKELYLKRAECLGFPTGPVFEYDGHSGFCGVSIDKQ